MWAVYVGTVYCIASYNKFTALRLASVWAEPKAKGNGDTYEGRNWRSISLSYAVGKLYVRLQIGVTGIEQYAIRSNRGCVNLNFAVDLGYEKYLAKGKDVN